jgi:hypothetical protein
MSEDNLSKARAARKAGPRRIHREKHTQERLDHLKGLLDRRVPQSSMFRGVFDRVLAGSAPRSTAIKAMCLNCCGLDRIAVEECKDMLCPLWHHRPFQRK